MFKRFLLKRKLNKIDKILNRYGSTIKYNDGTYMNTFNVMNTIAAMWFSLKDDRYDITDIIF